jgi:hypothetical protein
MTPQPKRPHQYLHFKPQNINISFCRYLVYTSFIIGLKRTAQFSRILCSVVAFVREITSLKAEHHSVLSLIILTSFLSCLQHVYHINTAICITVKFSGRISTWKTNCKTCTHAHAHIGVTLTYGIQQAKDLQHRLHTSRIPGLSQYDKGASNMAEGVEQNYASRT